MLKNKKAVAYLRTSSATNVGEDKDSHKRQMAAIERYASQAALEIVLPPYYDAAVKGADSIDARAGFAAMLAYMAVNPDVRTILVETAGRFARDLIVQETGYSMLKQRGIELIAVDSPDSFVSDTPTAVFVRQVLGAAAQLEKTMLVSKLQVARERKRAQNGKCEGRKSHQELHPQVVELARSLRWINKRMKERRSFRDIAQVLAGQGHTARSGKPFGPSAIKAMLEG
ncbi:MAG: Resolvase domain protein [Gammaproteobacteria bacterium]|nr:Resolvase domain protein [Gammaproteobacteria bacterium]